VSSKRAKYRTEAEHEENIKYYANVMYDKRIVRGNTYATQPAIRSFLPPGASTLISTAGRTGGRGGGAGGATRPRNYYSQTGSMSSSMGAGGAGAGTSGLGGAGGFREEQQTQTEDYLEELVDQIFEQDSAAQTDASLFEEIALPPLFVAKKQGESRSTQIEEGDLFDFNKEVEPILEVLIGKW
jgi:hypothetical protein